MANGSSAVFFSALEALVNFAYNGRVEIDQYNVQSLLIAASFLHLQSVKDACCDFLKERCVSLTRFILMDSSHAVMYVDKLSMEFPIL